MDEPKTPPPPKPPPPKPAAPASRPAAAGGAPKAEHKPPPPPAAPVGPPDPPPPADVPVPSFITELQTAVTGGVTQLSYFVGDWTVIVPAARLLDVARHLRAAGFDHCSDVTASDWPPRAQRFDVVYALYSVRDRRRVRLKVRAGEGEPVSSVTGIWPSANWLEREVYDLFGVAFVGHPDLRRILMPEDWQGHPQRKDYPLEGPGELLMESPLDWLKLKQAATEAEIE
ncbi:MAG TPA: NADH-quinone oxidoreductase subunit C [Vicinamibacterales bacterium]|nr:NADH-quinone oxidoreductase subunit C [Vicinamibacterales bacterium]